MASPPSIIVSSANIRASESEVEPPIRAQPTRMGVGPLNFPFLTSDAINGSHHFPPSFITYGRCMRNHWYNSDGGFVLDGCGEFMPLHTASPSDPSFLICDACGCHRSFHRGILHPLQPIHQVVDYLCPSGSTPDTLSSLPISSSYYPPPAQPNMLMSFNLAGVPPQNPINNNNRPLGSGSNQNKDKRFRSKFSKEEIDKMLEFVGRLGWRIQNKIMRVFWVFVMKLGLL
ncbi:Homeodomain-like protein [Artemisia annua]|uniref:Homeodomain-like protein n=1 Tax=Artemisia annua TaxID=35608 RepID=A0A2U1M068_ARTAN|nr:Homeodomain-like protein [Artemisia annua]